MPLIKLRTKIKAPIERVFDLARSIDLHQLSTKKTNEKAIAGRTSGLIELGETVTWRAKHLGVYQKLSVEITEFDQPNTFKDVMLTGAFKKMSHTHVFKKEKNTTIMLDEFHFESPLGVLGQFVDFIFLKNYMTKFLKDRNEAIKMCAESMDWKQVLNKN